MFERDTFVHLLAGGCAGTIGATLTCPLEVVKTRLQSSSVSLFISEVQHSPVQGTKVKHMTPGPLRCLKLILEKEGPRSLFRGLGPNLVGVAPSRAIYFGAYSYAKEKLSTILEPDSTQVHMVSAALAGFTAITVTNPIWLVKTRLQLDARGMSASYAGISETVVHFVIYENIKQKLVEAKVTANMDNDNQAAKEASDFARLMVAAATSKTFATILAYPHEVIRTRLREEGNKYCLFFQTISLVTKEEGFQALYRGLTTHLLRQIPNTAIVMCTYELVVHLLNG